MTVTGTTLSTPALLKVDRLLKSYISPEMNPEEYVPEELETLIKELHSTIPQLNYIGIDDIKNSRIKYSERWKKM